MLAVCTDGEEVADDPRAPFIKQPPLSGKFERPGSVLGQAGARSKWNRTLSPSRLLTALLK